MSRMRNVFSRTAFQWLLALAALVLFHGPFLAQDGPWPQPLTYFYLLAVWALAVAALMCLGLVLGGGRRRGERPEDRR